MLSMTLNESTFRMSGNRAHCGDSARRGVLCAALPSFILNSLNKMKRDLSVKFDAQVFAVCLKRVLKCRQAQAIK